MALKEVQLWNDGRHHKSEFLSISSALSHLSRVIKEEMKSYPPFEGGYPSSFGNINAIEAEKEELKLTKVGQKLIYKQEPKEEVEVIAHWKNQVVLGYKLYFNSQGGKVWIETDFSQFEEVPEAINKLKGK
jgi:hypothetical protein